MNFRRCDVKKERKLENQRIRKYNQFCLILSCPEIENNIFKQLNIEDHINLGKAMMDDYVKMLLGRKTMQTILNTVLVNINLTKLQHHTLELLGRSQWKHISMYSDLDESFIIKWSHKLNFFFLKNNLPGDYNEEYKFVPRVFSKKFHSIFPGFKTYEPCHLCCIDTQWFSNIFLEEENIWFCKDCFEKVCNLCFEEFCKGECVYDDEYNSYDHFCEYYYDWY